MLRSIWRGVLGGLVSLTVAGAALAQANVNQTPSNYKSPSGAYAFGGALNLFGTDSVTGAQCLVGLTATCQVPITGSFSATVGFVATTATNASSTITTGGAFQSALASNGARKGCLIQNPISATETLYVYFGATGSATTANSITLGPGAAVSCAVGGLGVATDNVAVEAATTGHAFVEMSQ